MAPAAKFDAKTQREMILCAAESCIKETSITNFTMANIAATAGLSMGSVYKFVQSKEDIILALAHQSFEHQSNIFQRLLSTPLSTPEKVIAIYLIAPDKLQCFDFDYDLQSFATNEAVIRRASEQWTQKIIDASNRCQTLFRDALIAGIASGELAPQPNQAEIIEEIILSCWAMSVGYEQVIRVKQTQQISEDTAEFSTPLDHQHPIIRSTIRLINSYPWKTPIDQSALQKIDLTLQTLELR